MINVFLEVSITWLPRYVNACFLFSSSSFFFVKFFYVIDNHARIDDVCTGFYFEYRANKKSCKIGRLPTLHTLVYLALVDSQL